MKTSDIYKIIKRTVFMRNIIYYMYIKGHKH